MIDYYSLNEDAMFRAITALSCLAIASIATPANALEAEQRVLKEVAVPQADGTVKKTYVKAELVTPGDTVVYALIFRNDQPQPAEDIVLVMPVPAEVRYTEGSAANRLASADYSADGGTTFNSRSGLTVREADGRVRPAAADDITHVRWTVSNPVMPGQTGQLWYRGILK